MTKINHYKLKPNITREDLISYGLKEGGNWVLPEADLFKTGYFQYRYLEYSITIAINSSTMKFDDCDNVLILDEDFGQPYSPFYKYYGKNVANFEYLENVIKKYNEWMDSLEFLEKENN